MIDNRSMVKRDQFRARRRALWQAYGPKFSYIPITTNERDRVRLSLRLMFGAPTHLGSDGAAIWAHANIVLTEYPYQIRGDTGNNPKIMDDLFAMIQAWEEIDA